MLYKKSKYWMCVCEELCMRKTDPLCVIYKVDKGEVYAMDFCDHNFLLSCYYYSVNTFEADIKSGKLVPLI